MLVAVELVLQELALPPESDLYRFPAKADTTKARLLNRDYCRYLEGCLALCARDRQKIDRDISEVRRRYLIWDCLDDCYCMRGVQRRRELNRLRFLLGDEMYHGGVMPHPLWGY